MVTRPIARNLPMVPSAPARVVKGAIGSGGKSAISINEAVR